MKTLLWNLLAGLALGILPPLASAQVNSGSNGSDGALNPTGNLVINMADHPTGIYQYTSVNIPAGVTVSFIPNAGNKPVVWLVQGNCVINGTLNLNGDAINGPQGKAGGPGGGAGGQAGFPPLPGSGLGSGGVGPQNSYTLGGNASFGTLAVRKDYQHPSGSLYGNKFLLPFLEDRAEVVVNTRATAMAEVGVAVQFLLPPQILLQSMA